MYPLREQTVVVEGEGVWGRNALGVWGPQVQTALQDG